MVLIERDSRASASGLPVSFCVFDSDASLEAVAAAWDDLAIECASPYGAPAWMRAWWRAAAPDGALLRVVAVFAEGKLVGIAPFYAEAASRGTAVYRLLAHGVAPGTQPLARRGFESAVAGVVANVLATAEPRPRVIEFVHLDVESPWPHELRDRWPGTRRPLVHLSGTTPMPVLRLAAESCEAWLESKSGSFRKQMRRVRRQLEAHGAVFRRSEDDDLLGHDVHALAELHLQRWSWRGGSGVMDEAIERMLVDAGTELVSRERFRLWTIDVNGRTISAHLFLEAGGAVAYWLGGFEETWAPQQPGMLAIMAAVDEAFTRGDERLEFGPGGQAYKFRFADSIRSVTTVRLVPPSRFAFVQYVAIVAFSRWHDQTLNVRRFLGRHLSSRQKRAVFAISRWRSVAPTSVRDD